MENTNNNVKLDAQNLARITKRFSGLNDENQPKSIVTYCSYNYDDESDKNRDIIYGFENAKVELSFDSFNGFYILDFIFDSHNNTDLKLLWGRLQQHKENEVYRNNDTWLFCINLLERNNNLEPNSPMFVANILNPLAFYLIRMLPNQLLEPKDETKIDEQTSCGGNCIRFLLHNSLVTFKNINATEEQDYLLGYEEKVEPEDDELGINQMIKDVETLDMFRIDNTEDDEETDIDEIE